jgi:hypothetical protein
LFTAYEARYQFGAADVANPSDAGPGMRNRISFRLNTAATQATKLFVNGDTRVDGLLCAKDLLVRLAVVLCPHPAKPSIAA